MRHQDSKRSKSALIQDNSLSSPHAKAERLKRVRNLANLSREEFCADGEINLTTLVSWEVGRFGGLSKKGAASVIARVAKEGVFVTPEWLLYEVGAGPEVQADYKKIVAFEKMPKQDVQLPSEKERIMEELMLFKKLNKNAMDFIINDDAMLPHYQLGDYVAGTKRFADQISSVISYNCIVQVIDGRIFMRNLQRGSRDGLFNLIATNFQSTANNAYVYDVELVSAAPVVWHRRREPAK